MAQLRARPDDTSPEVWQRMMAAYRDMSTNEKVRIIRALNAGAEKMAEIGVRQRYPDASDEEVKLRLGALRIEPELMKAAFGWDPEIHGR